MNKVLQYVRSHPLSLLLITLPVTALGEYALHWSPVTIFALAAVGIIPLAAYIGEATEALAHYTSPRTGALLNATLGNAAELIITIAAVRAGLLELVKASITGSILGNLLLVLGLSMIYGGLKHGIQTFNRRQAGRNAILLVLAVIAMLIPSYLSHYIGADDNQDTNILRIGFVAGEISRHGGAVICAAISPYRAAREEARKFVGENFIEIFMDTPVEVCEQRDVKGLYAKARQAMVDGKPMGFTGVDDPYEPPVSPEISLQGYGSTPEENAHKIVAYLVEQGYLLNE